MKLLKQTFDLSNSAHLMYVYSHLSPTSPLLILETTTVPRMEPWQSSERLHDSNCWTRETIRNDGDFRRTFRQDLQYRRTPRREQHQRVLAVENCLLSDERASQEENYLVRKGELTRSSSSSLYKAWSSSLILHLFSLDTPSSNTLSKPTLTSHLKDKSTPKSYEISSLQNGKNN